jgi:hypothetical protein
LTPGAQNSKAFIDGAARIGARVSWIHSAGILQSRKRWNQEEVGHSFGAASLGATLR